MSNKKFICQKNLPLNIYSSYAGFYIGTFICEGEDVGPNCRCSGYYRTEMEARNALETRTFNRVCMENDMCHGGKGCQVKEVE